MAENDKRLDVKVVLDAGDVTDEKATQTHRCPMCAGKGSLPGASFTSSQSEWLDSPYDTLLAIQALLHEDEEDLMELGKLNAQLKGLDTPASDLIKEKTRGRRQKPREND